MSACGAFGTSAEGYCVCTRPADHEGAHACEHGWWDR